MTNQEWLVEKLEHVGGLLNGNRYTVLYLNDWKCWTMGRRYRRRS